jgi:hypothetical protein
MHKTIIAALALLFLASVARADHADPFTFEQVIGIIDGKDVPFSYWRENAQGTVGDPDVGASGFNCINKVGAEVRATEENADMLRRFICSKGKPNAYTDGALSED